MTNEDTGTQVIEWNINDAAIEEAAVACRDIDAYQDLDAAKQAKKGLTKMRTKLSEAHKETKAEALAFGRKVDAEKNRLLILIRAIEDPITEQLDEIKNAEAKAEEERLQKIMNYIEGIQAFALDRHSLTLEELVARRDELHSRGIDPEVTQEHHEDAQLSYDEADLKLRLAIDAEETRLKEEAEKAAVEEENRVLREKLEKAEADQAERDAAARKEIEEAAEEQRKKDAERQAELDAQQAEIDKENARLAQEQADKEDAEEAERVAEEAAKLAALQAPDKDKLELFAADLKTLIDSKPVMGSTAGASILLSAMADLIATHGDLIYQTEEL